MFSRSGFSPGGQRRFSRRTVMLGGAAVAVAAGVGGGIWWLTSPHLLATYRGHTNGVNAVAWSPNGKHVASSSDDKTVQVWNAADGTPRFTCKGHFDEVSAVTWEASVQQISAGISNTTVQVWNAADGTPLFPSTVHFQGVNFDEVFALAWSPDRKRIALGMRDGTVQVWEVTRSTVLSTYKGHSGAVLALSWDPSGEQVASGSFGSVQVSDVTTGSQIATSETGGMDVDVLAWSPDGKRIASSLSDPTASGDGGFPVHVFNAVNGSHVSTYRPTTCAMRSAVQPSDAGVGACQHPWSRTPGVSSLPCARLKAQNTVSHHASMLRSLGPCSWEAEECSMRIVERQTRRRSRCERCPVMP